MRLQRRVNRSSHSAGLKPEHEQVICERDFRFSAVTCRRSCCGGATRKVREAPVEPIHCKQFSNQEKENDNDDRFQRREDQQRR